jgi:hypothetical protein
MPVGAGHRLSPGISRCCKSHLPAHAVEDESSSGLRGQLLVLAMNFVIVRSLAGEPLEWAAPSIGRAFGPKRQNIQTNLIPQSDSRPTTEETTGIATGGQDCLPYTHAVTVRFRKYRKTAC